MGIPRPRAEQRPAPTTALPVLLVQACGDVADYIGASPEAVAALWPDVVSAWGAYLRSGRYGDDAVTDLLTMDTLLQDSLDRQQPGQAGC